MEIEWADPRFKGIFHNSKDNFVFFQKQSSFSNHSFNQIHLIWRLFSSFQRELDRIA